MRKYIYIMVGLGISISIFFCGLRLGDFIEVLRNAALLCLSCVGIAN